MDQNQSNLENHVGDVYEMLPKNAAYYRARARELIREKWKTVVLISFLAIILGGVIAGGFTYQFDLPSDVEYSDFSDHPVLNEAVLDASFFVWIVKAVLIVIVTSAVFSLAFSVFVSSPIKLGYQRANLDLVDGAEPEVKTLFSYFKIAYWRSVLLNLFYTLITTLVVAIPAFATAAVALGMVSDIMLQMVATDPVLLLSSIDLGVVLAYVPILLLLSAITCAAAVFSSVLHYTYRYAYMVMAEYPNMSAVEALRVSRTMMKGRKWKLFCLDFSFIGWYLLAVIFTLGIGLIFLYPYREAAFAVFYHDAAHRDAAKETEFPSLNFDDYASDEGGFDFSKLDLSSTANEGADEDEGDAAEAPSSRAESGASPFGGSLQLPSLDLNDYSGDEGEFFYKPTKKKKDDTDSSRPL